VSFRALSCRGKRWARQARGTRLRATARAQLSADPAASIWADLHEFDRRIVTALVLAEDRRFWIHHGIDWSAVRAAAVRNLQHRRIIFGASTIPMQVAQMLRAWSTRTYARKLRESLLAVWLVVRYGREPVLEIYLNLVPVVSGTRGVVAGSLHWAGCDPRRQVSVLDATLVAAAVSVCPDPSSETTAPFASWLHDKQMRLIEDLLESGEITPPEAAAASFEIATKWASADNAHDISDDRAFPPTSSLGSTAVRARRRALRWALAQVGTTDSPTDGAEADGRVESWLHEFGMSGVGWCGAFVGYALRLVAGIHTIDVRVVWVPYVLEDAGAGRLGWESIVHPCDAGPGDVALFNWEGSHEPQHIGFVIANDPARSVVHTVEGNTTRDGKGDQADGGGVFVRERPYGVIVACARPRYSSARYRSEPPGRNDVPAGSSAARGGFEPPNEVNPRYVRWTC
jgi:hypothetical protein